MPFFGRSPVAVTTDGGEKWTVAGTPQRGSMALGCMTSDTCVIEGPLGIAVSTDGGATWTTEVRFPSTRAARTNPFGAVSCNGPSHCAVLVTQVQTMGRGSQRDSLALFLTSDSGRTWSRRVPLTILSPSPGLGVASAMLSCPAAGHCRVAVADNGPGRREQRKPSHTAPPIQHGRLRGDVDRRRPSHGLRRLYLPRLPDLLAHRAKRVVVGAAASCSNDRRRGDVEDGGAAEPKRDGNGSHQCGAVVPRVEGVRRGHGRQEWWQLAL
jgi:hypothetical protein